MLLQQKGRSDQENRRMEHVCWGNRKRRQGQMVQVYALQVQMPSTEGLFEGIGNDIKFAMAKASYNFQKFHKTMDE